MEPSTSINQSLKNNIASSITWARYAAIISFVNLGLGFLQIIVGVVKGNLNVFSSLFSFLISAVITLVMSINLYRYSQAAKNSVNNSDAILLNQALYHLRIYFIVMGVLFLIVLGLLLLFLLIAIIAAIIAVAN